MVDLGSRSFRNQVKVRVQVPTRLSAKEREALESLRAADERNYRKDVEGYGA